MSKCFVAAMVLVTSVATAPALADDDTIDVLSVVSEAETVPEAIEAIVTTFEQRGFEEIFTLNHAANAKSVGLKLPPTTVVFFTNSGTDRFLINRSQTSAIDLPWKCLVYHEEKSNEGESGEIEGQSAEIKTACNPVGYVIDRHDIGLRATVFRQLQSVVSEVGALEEKGLVTIESLRSFEDTVTSLQNAISGNSAFRIPLEIDFREERNAARPTTLIVFGNPEAGTPLMQNNQSIGLDLPQKFLVWEDRDGVVHITYNDPLFIARRHGIEGQEMRLKMIKTALGNFAAAGAGTSTQP